MTDIFQRTNDSLSLNLTIKGERETGNLILNLQNAPSQPYWLKLFDAQDKELRSVYGNDQKFRFTALKPGEYYFKLIVDENANGRHDTGNFFENRQPERIYIYPANITVRAFWDIEEVWVLGNETADQIQIPDAPQRKSEDELEITRPLNTGLK